MNEWRYIMLHKQFVYCNHSGTASHRQEEEDSCLVSKGLEKVAIMNNKNPGSTYVEELVWADVNVQGRSRV